MIITSIISRTFPSSQSRALGQRDLLCPWPRGESVCPCGEPWGVVHVPTAPWGEPLSFPCLFLTSGSHHSPSFQIPPCGTNSSRWTVPTVSTRLLVFHAQPQPYVPPRPRWAGRETASRAASGQIWAEEATRGRVPECSLPQREAEAGLPQTWELREQSSFCKHPGCL